jgi:PAS domain S-box-containing protein
MGVATTDWAHVIAAAQRMAGFGVWEWDIPAGNVTWSDSLHRIYGLEPSEFPSTVDGFFARVHPEDRDRVGANLSHAIDTLESFAYEERIVRADGVVRVLLSHGLVLADPAGRAATLLGVCHDVTDRIAYVPARSYSRALPWPTTRILPTASAR